jgi:23S rRNA pseudouridine2605 synthase
LAPALAPRRAQARPPGLGPGGGFGAHGRGPRAAARGTAMAAGSAAPSGRAPAGPWWRAAPARRTRRPGSARPRPGRSGGHGGLGHRRGGPRPRRRGSGSSGTRAMISRLGGAASGRPDGRAPRCARAGSLGAAAQQRAAAGGVGAAQCRPAVRRTRARGPGGQRRALGGRAAPTGRRRSRGKGAASVRL